MTAAISKTSLLSLYETMVRQRTLEEEVEELFKQGLIPGLAHPYIGQEAVAAGVCAALGEGDLVVSNHRGHGHSVAKGVPERAILSELMGKDAGMCLGLEAPCIVPTCRQASSFLQQLSAVGYHLPLASHWHCRWIRRRIAWYASSETGQLTPEHSMKD